ncbi:MAG TPA: DUF5777 family beta-barrel protein [Thermoanaerobaculia bacterium]|nr:DUF5777 family beta-barrel protein [Thermoanaerobaculia bacterium]
MRLTPLAALLAALLLALPAAAQDEEVPGNPDEPIRRDPIGTRLVNGATPYPVGARKIELLFTHRFQEPVQNGTSHDLWGLDSGADVGIGLGVGITRRIDFSIYRSSFQEDFEISSKVLVIEQAPRVPVSVSLRAGTDLLRRPGVPEPGRPFFQLLLARQIVPGVNLLLSPSWVRDTPQLRNAFNVPLGLTFPLPRGYLVEVEVIPKNHDLDTSLTAWHAALSKQVGGHIFEIVAGNSRATTVDQMLGGDSAAGFATRDVRLGFNLVRYFGF